MRGVAYATRASALALLSSQGGERHYKPGEVRKAREGKPVDNTLEVVTLVSSKYCCTRGKTAPALL